MSQSRKSTKADLYRLEMSFRMRYHIRQLVYKKVGTDTTIIRLFFMHNKLLREWYRLGKAGYNPTFFTLCDFAKAMRIPINILLNIDMNLKFKKFKSYPFLVCSNNPKSWKSHSSRKDGFVPWEYESCS